MVTITFYCHKEDRSEVQDWALSLGQCSGGYESGKFYEIKGKLASIVISYQYENIDLIKTIRKKSHNKLILAEAVQHPVSNYEGFVNTAYCRNIDEFAWSNSDFRLNLEADLKRKAKVKEKRLEERVKEYNKTKAEIKKELIRDLRFREDQLEIKRRKYDRTKAEIRSEMSKWHDIAFEYFYMFLVGLSYLTVVVPLFSYIGKKLNESEDRDKANKEVIDSIKSKDQLELLAVKHSRKYRVADQEVKNLLDEAIVDLRYEELEESEKVRSI